ncbi:hypothetical protein ACQ4PT_004916 [Festuca glaucescens]
MASTNSWTLELESRVATQRKFRACVMDWHNLAPKLAPYIFNNAHHAEGDGGIGSVRHYNCNSAMPFNIMKKKVEFLDVDKCECKYTIECDGTETATFNVKVKPTANGQRWECGEGGMHVQGRGREGQDAQGQGLCHRNVQHC